MRNMIRQTLLAIAALVSIVAGAISFDAQFDDSQLTYDDYVAFVAVINHEAQLTPGGLRVTDVTSEHNTLERVIAVVRDRSVTESSIMIGGEEMTKAQYRVFRAGLARRWEKNQPKK